VITEASLRVHTQSAEYQPFILDLNETAACPSSRPGFGRADGPSFHCSLYPRLYLGVSLVVVSDIFRGKRLGYLPDNPCLPTTTLRKMKKAPATAGAKSNEAFTYSVLTRSLAVGHAAAGLAFVSINRNQESVAVGVGEFVSLHIGAVLERAIHFEAIVVLRPEIFHVL